MGHTVYATVIRYYEEYIKADSKETAMKIAEELSEKIG